MQILAYFTNKSLGTLDEHGRTGTIMAKDQEEIDVIIGFKDADWGIEMIEEEEENNSDEFESCSPEDEGCETLGSDDDNGRF